MNANEIANGVLSALVSITAGCAVVDSWGAVFIGGKLPSPSSEPSPSSWVIYELLTVSGAVEQHTDTYLNPPKQ